MTWHFREKLPQLPDWFRILLGIFVPWFAIVCTALSFIAIYGLLRGGVQVDNIVNWLMDMFGLPAPWQQFISSLIVTLAWVMIAIGILFCYLLLPSLFAFIPALPVSLFWKKPKRVLVLRKFHVKDDNNRLEGLIRKHISRAGYSFTLACSLIHVRFWVKWTIFSTQLGLLCFKPKSVRNQEDLRRVLADASLTWMRNFNWALSMRKLFPIRTSDSIWRECVATFAAWSDVIITDLSSAKESSAIEWELELCRERGFLKKLIILTTTENYPEKVQFLGKCGVHISDVCGIIRQDSVEEVHGLRNAIDRAATARVYDGLCDRLNWNERFGSARRAFLHLTLLPAIILVMLPLLPPGSVSLLGDILNLLQLL